MKEIYEQTKNIYQKLGKKYLQDISSLTPDDLYDFIKMMPKGGKVLEVGCAGGRDSKIMAENGLTVTGIDVVDDFLSEANSVCPTGTFLNMSVLELDFPEGSFDGIWAHAVLLHLSDEDLKSALVGLKKALNDKGIIFVSFKLGENEAIVQDSLSQGESRYFNFTTEAKMLNLLSELGFKVVKKRIVPDDAKRAGIDWIRIFAQKA